MVITLTRAAQLVATLAPREGYTETRLPAVRLMRADRCLERTPVLYEPSIVIVVSGRKLGYLGDRAFVYDRGRYLVLSIPMPFSSETVASADDPMLAVAIRLDPSTVADLLLSLSEVGASVPPAPNGLLSTTVDAPLADATLRLLESLSSPADATILGPSILREIVYRVLTGEQGGAVRAALGDEGRFGRVARALKRMHAEYDTRLDVDTLAGEAGMSAPAFHAHFKAVTCTSPMQYLKAMRLHHARIMMIRQDLTAAAAASRVGYESASQFSREFRRLFGASPVDETRRMKSIFAVSGPV